MSRVQAVRAKVSGVARHADSLRTQLDAAFAWLLARGWLLAVAFAVVIGRLGDTRVWSIKHAWLPHAGLRGHGALVALAAFVVLSLWLGGGRQRGTACGRIARQARLR